MLNKFLNLIRERYKSASQVQPIQPAIEDDVPGLFRTLYGVSPPDDVLASVRSCLSPDCVLPYDRMRTIIAALDRQTWSTPVSVRFSERDLETINLDGFTLILDRADLAVSSPIIAEKGYEPHLTAFIREEVRPGMTVVDVGANVGYYTMLIAHLVGSTGNVLAFEPNTENCRLNILSKEANGFNQIKLYPLALSTSNGVAYFSPMIGSNGGFLPNDSSTLMNPNCIVVPTMTMTDIINEAVDLIRVDVEGAEYLVLSGGKSIIEKYRPIIVTEFSMEMIPRVSGISGTDFLKWMESLGYSAAILDKNKGVRIPINDVDALSVNWGSLTRIEDIAFLPTN